MELIQNAYQGFAKQNFTMLDNLKLGYGGTKEEMQRLLDDAEKISGIEYDISSFADITEAIHIMQEEMGIAGTTAKEAGTTIEGSVKSMKSAWQNLLTGIADDNADFEKLIDDFIVTIVGDGTESNLGVFGNVLPRIEIALEGAVKLIEGIFPAIIKVLPGLFQTLVPSLITGAVNIIEALVKGLRDNADMLAETAVDAVFTLAEGILSMLPDIIELGLDLIIALANGITEAIQDDDFIQTIIDVVLQMVDVLTDPETLTNLINSALDLILALVEGLLSEDSIDALVDATFQIIEAIVDYLTTPENILKLVETAVDLVVAIADGLVSALFKIDESIDELTEEMVTKFEETDWLQLGKDIINSIWDGMANIWYDLTDWFAGEFDWFNGKLSSASSLVSGLTSGAGGMGGLVSGAGGIFLNGSHASGLYSVPFDGYIAELHKGERVLTASEAQRYNNGQYYGGRTDVNVTVGFDDTNLNANRLARVLYPALKVVEQEVYA